MRALLRWLALVLVAGAALQLFFAARIALMAVLDPRSTAFQRSEAWRLASGKSRPYFSWRQDWVPYERMPDNLKRAVIASEDDGFVRHDGVDWDATGKAWQKNAKAEQQATQRASRTRSPGARLQSPRIVGGSTITQQLAKNLLLSGERTLLRKGQEFVLSMLLEQLLDKQRILELYLNSVEWGEGVFGAEAAAWHYFHKPAARLSAYEAARLAVMLPRPRVFERLPDSVYLAGRASLILRRMGDAELP